MEIELKEKGYTVLIIPEGATELIINGICPGNAGISMEDFQYFILKKQLNKESLYDVASKMLESEKIVIIHDRGAMDGKAYVSDSDFKTLLSGLHLNEIDIRDTYDAVLHLVTAAVGAESAYTTTNNKARRETVEEARELDKKTMNAWIGHPHLRVIDNSTDFETKIKRAMKEVYAVLGEPIPTEIERKFLIKMPDISMLVSKYNAVQSNIVQTYLKSDGDLERRVRQRGLGNNFSFYYTEKRKVSPDSGMERIEKERRITNREYLTLLLEADTTKHHIVKDRYCFEFQNQYFELDIYPQSETEAILEIELTDRKDEVVIPDFIEVIKEVTDDDFYKNYKIAERESL